MIICYLEKKGVTMKYILICLMALMTSCTYSINMAHTEGQARGTIAEDQEADPDLTATVPFR